jgi:hypothetical protein
MKPMLQYGVALRKEIIYFSLYNMWKGLRIAMKIKALDIKGF